MTKFFANKILLTTLLVSILALNIYSQITEERNDLKKFYDEYNFEGSFVLYDQNNDKYIFYNEPQFKKLFTPASTFKICNSLIGLETGVIKDAGYVLPWDSVKRWIPAWNQDQNLEAAYKNSTVWYYQELARRVG